MNRTELLSQIKSKKSYLCVGLDTDKGLLPFHLRSKSNGVVEFNKAIIEATSDFAVSYKINTAFYEQYGAEGWEMMEETLSFIPSNCFTIADAKRGDIGNTSKMYARAFFEKMNFDAITVAPYMGFDSVRPFLEFENKWVIVLGLTSNPGSADFQELVVGDQKLYEKVIQTVSGWASSSQLMFVTGATKSSMLASIRRQVPDYFLLVPGVGAQGGSLTDVSEAAIVSNGGILVNSSRGIIYASSGEDYADKAKQEALKLQTEMAVFTDLL